LEPDKFINQEWLPCIITLILMVKLVLFTKISLLIVVSEVIKLDRVQ